MQREREAAEAWARIHPAPGVTVRTTPIPAQLAAGAPKWVPATGGRSWHNGPDGRAVTGAVLPARAVVVPGYVQDMAFIARYEALADLATVRRGRGGWTGDLDDTSAYVWVPDEPLITCATCGVEWPDAAHRRVCVSPRLAQPISPPRSLCGSSTPTRVGNPVHDGRTPAQIQAAHAARVAYEPVPVSKRFPPPVAFPVPRIAFPQWVRDPESAK